MLDAVHPGGLLLAVTSTSTRPHCEHTTRTASTANYVGANTVDRLIVGGHLKLPAGGQWVPDDGHYGVWPTRREVFDDVAPGPGVR